MSLFNNKKDNVKPEVKEEIKTEPVAEKKPEPVNEPKTQKEVKAAPAVKAETAKPSVSVAEPTVDEDKLYDETGLIAAGTKIEGNITSHGHMIIDGSITGNTNIKGNLVIRGAAGGDINCANILIDSLSLKTNINADNNVIVDEKSVFTGKINCKNITVYGKVDGDIIAKEAVVLKNTAIVKGTITAARIGIEPGAVLNGSVKIK